MIEFGVRKPSSFMRWTTPKWNGVNHPHPERAKDLDLSTDEQRSLRLARILTNSTAVRGRYRSREKECDRWMEGGMD